LPTRLKDIARDLGISPMAVSKALRNHGDIGEETKERVLRRAAELNYRVDWVARSLRAGKSYLVGLVVPDLMQSFFAEIATAVAETLGPAGYHLVILHTRENAEEEITNLELLIARKVDGLIIASAQHSGRVFKKLTAPYVLIDRKLSGLSANFVGSHNEEVGRIATEHLIEQGCRRIAHLTGPKVSSAAGRLVGYRRALKKHGLPLREDWTVPAGHDDQAGYAAMRGLLARKLRPDGVFCFNDPVAVGAMRATLEAGLAIPGEIALIGAANMHYSDLLVIPLSTVDQGTARIGALAAQRLLVCMNASRRLAPETVLVPPRLIVRAASRRLTQASAGVLYR
jgi:LacI family transcriptional regulator